jgi:hypothetical protein
MEKAGIYKTRNDKSHAESLKPGMQKENQNL